MQFLRILGLVAIAATATQRVSGPEVVAVQTVTDGGSIDVGVYGRVRLAGIRVPRAGRAGMDVEPFGREAHERLEGMVAHRYVRLEFPTAAARSSAYVLLEDGTFVNAVLVREGLARVTDRFPGARHDALVRAEEEARAARRGLWGVARAACAYLIPRAAQSTDPRALRVAPGTGRRRSRPPSGSV